MLSVTIHPAKFLILLAIILLVIGFFVLLHSQRGGYTSCAQAKAAGHVNIRRGQQGYSSSLDRDKDGIACEG